MSFIRCWSDGLAQPPKALTANSGSTTRAITLTHFLLPLVKASPRSRIVMTACAAQYRVSHIAYPAIASPNTYDRLRNYCGSKLATVRYVRSLARTLATTHPNVTVNCLHPGSCNTNLFKNSLYLLVLTTIGLQYVLRTPQRGARTIVYLSVSEEVESVSGEYWFDERIRQRSAASGDRAKQQELMRIRPLGSRVRDVTPNGGCLVC